MTTATVLLLLGALASAPTEALHGPTFPTMRDQDCGSGRSAPCIVLIGRDPGRGVEAPAPDLSRIESLAPGGQEPSCARSEDDPGFGGTRVECEFTCRSTNLLTIEVFASDGDATSYGSVDCADQSAICDKQVTGNHCFGESDGVTRQSGRGECRGSSDEFWSSAVTVECRSVGQDTLCQAVPQLCEGSAAGLRQACGSVLSSLSDPDIAALAPQLDDGVSSVLVLHFEGTQATVLSLSTDGEGIACGLTAL